MMPSFAALVGKDDAFAAARVLVPFLHGFISMELAKAFQLGPGLDAAFEQFTIGEPELLFGGAPIGMICRRQLILSIDSGATGKADSVMAGSRRSPLQECNQWPWPRGAPGRDASGDAGQARS